MTAAERRTAAAAEQRGQKRIGGFDGSILKDKEGNNYDDANSWDKHYFYVGGK